MEKKIISGLAHLAHHDQHWEYCWGYDERVKYIKKYKPIEEQELRLKWFAVVPDDKLPGRDSPEWVACTKAWVAYAKAWDAYVREREAYTKAGKACVKAGVAYTKAWVAYEQARAAYDKAEEVYLLKYAEELDKLHAEMFPGCPWNGKTMFPLKEVS